MGDRPTILALAGSTRAGSFNRRLLHNAARAAEAAGAAVTVVELGALAMPLYDGDLEKAHGLPENARRLKRMMIEHDALLVASPEYNGSLTAVLKNAIDWASRKEGDEPPLAAFSGKVAAIVSASPGRLGGARSLMALRHVLSVCGALVIPNQFALAQANAAFDENGDLVDAAAQAAVAGVAHALVETARRIRAGSRPQPR